MPLRIAVNDFKHWLLFIKTDGHVRIDNRIRISG